MKEVLWGKKKMKESKHFPATKETSLYYERLQTCLKLSGDRSQFPVQGDGTGEAQAGMLPWAPQNQAGHGGFAGALGSPGLSRGGREAPPGAGVGVGVPPAPPGGWVWGPTGSPGRFPRLRPGAAAPGAPGTPGWPPPGPGPRTPRALPEPPPAPPAGRVPPPAALTRGLAGVDPVRVRQAGDGEDVGGQEEAS